MQRFLLLLIFVSINLSFVHATPTLNSTTITGASYNGTDYVFSPNGDGTYDNVTIIMNSSDLVKFGTIFIYNSSWNKVDRFNAQSAFKYNKTVTWDGHFSSSYGNASSAVPDGIYFLNLTLTDQSNNSNTFTMIHLFVNNAVSSNSTENNSTPLNDTNVSTSTNESNQTNETANINTNAESSSSNSNEDHVSSHARERNVPLFYLNSSVESKPEKIMLEEKHAYSNNSFPFTISLLTLTAVLLIALILLVMKVK